MDSYTRPYYSRRMEQPEPKTLIKRLMSDAGMTETEIAAELTSSGVPVTQPTINRIKKGSGTSYEIGMGLLQLAQSRIKSKRAALVS
jgi:hypothetical protein